MKLSHKQYVSEEMVALLRDDNLHGETSRIKANQIRRLCSASDPEHTEKANTRLSPSLKVATFRYNVFDILQIFVMKTSTRRACHC